MVKRLLLSMGALLVAFACAAYFIPAEFPQWHMIDVNGRGPQGDAHLLIDGDQVVLVDVGRAVDTVGAVIPYLRQRGINKIDHLFISHPHTDHYQGIVSLISSGIAIERIYHNELPDNVSDFDYKPSEYRSILAKAVNAGADLIDVEQGTRVKLANSVITVLFAAKEPFIDGSRLSVNDYSVVMGWDVGRHRALFTGDLDFKVGSVLAKAGALAAHVLKVPHHGVNGIAPNEFFNDVNPLITMLPQPNVLYRHPRGAQFSGWVDSSLLPGGNSLVIACRNGLNKSVVLTFEIDTISVSSGRPSPECPNRAVTVVDELPLFSQQVRLLPNGLSEARDKHFPVSILTMLLSDS